MDQKQIEKIRQWAQEQPDKPKFEEAVKRLVQIGLYQSEAEKRKLSGIDADKIRAL